MRFENIKTEKFRHTKVKDGLAKVNLESHYNDIIKEMHKVEKVVNKIIEGEW